jgi:SprT protein
LDKTTKIINVLKKYLPEGAEDYVFSLFSSYPVAFKIVRPRKSKLGDFRVPLSGQRPQITINGDLNSFSFLVTTVHEFAHLKTWLEYKNRVKPHGEEWKKNFVELMHPLIKMGILPRDIEQALLNSFSNMKASSCTDIQLQRVLKKYDVLDTNEILLEKLPKYATFALDAKVFEKGDLRRTRYLCRELNSGKQYLIYKLAIVEQV